MEKTFKEVAHLYLGCKVKWNDDSLFSEKISDFDLFQMSHINDIKPILHRLEDMTEYDKVNAINPMLYGFESIINQSEKLRQLAEITIFLLSKHYDLFNLIDNCQAIDAKTL